MLIGGLTAAPDLPILDLPILLEAERALLLHAWNATAAPYPDATVVDLFEAQAARTPLAPAVSSAGKVLGYRELDARANRLARHLRARGVAPRRASASAWIARWDMVVGLLGILKAGGAYVPLDPAYPRARLAFIAADAGLDALVTEKALASLVPVPVPWCGSTRTAPRSTRRTTRRSAPPPVMTEGRSRT